MTNYLLPETREGYDSPPDSSQPDGKEEMNPEEWEGKEQEEFSGPLVSPRELWLEAQV